MENTTFGLNIATIGGTHTKQNESLTLKQTSLKGYRGEIMIFYNPKTSNRQNLRNARKYMNEFNCPYGSLIVLINKAPFSRKIIKKWLKRYRGQKKLFVGESETRLVIHLTKEDIQRDIDQLKKQIEEKESLLTKERKL